MVNSFEGFGVIIINYWTIIIRRSGSQVLRIAASRIMDKVLFGGSDRYICPVLIDDWWSTNAKQKLHQIIWLKKKFIREVEQRSILTWSIKKGGYLFFKNIIDLHCAIFMDWLLCFRRREKLFPSRPWFIYQKLWKMFCIIYVYDLL